MNKILIAVLFATLLLMGGASSLLAEATQDSSESSYEVTELPSDSPPTLSGIGNGGGGNPG